MNKSKLDAALALARDNYRVFPLCPNSKQPLLSGSWRILATRSKEQITAWWTEFSEANIARVADGECIIDVDVKKNGDKSFEALSELYEFPPTRTVRTPSGGRHICYLLPPGAKIQNGTDVLGPGLDIRTDGGYVCAVGSVIDDKPYFHEDDRPSVVAPDHVVAGCKTAREKDKDAGKRIADEDETTVEQIEDFIARQKPGSVPEGGRDDEAYRVAARFGDYGARYETILEYLTVWSDLCCVPPMAQADLERVASSGGVRNRLTAIGSKHVDVRAKGFEVYTMTPEQQARHDRRQAEIDALEEEANEVAEGAIMAAGAVKTSLAYWLERDLPEPDRLMGALLSTTSRAMFFAPTGLGKTQIGIALGMRMSAGVDFLGWRGHRACRVLYVDGEMSRRLFQQRLRDEVKRLGTMPDGFHALSHEDLDMHWHPLNTPEGQGVIEKVLADIGKVDFAVFDNIMSLIEGDPKDTEAWSKTLRWVNRLTGRCIGQLWVHHANEQGKMYGDKTRAWRMDTVAVMEAIEHPSTDVSFRLTFDPDKGGKARERTPADRNDFATKHVTLIDDKWSHEVERKQKKVKTPMATQYLHALRAALSLASDGSSAEDAPPGTAITSERWKERCIQCGLIGADEPANKQRARFYKYRAELVVEGAIVVDGEMVRLRG